MITAVRTYIDKYQLLTEKEPVLVGLSGGADSVALLAVLVRLGYTCIAAHCNFHLRGQESDRDEVFSKNIARKLGVPFYKTDFDTVKYSEEKHISIEMAARELRYAWFEQMRQQLNAQAIAVAHHRDDSVETFLMNVIRGTGVRGVTGIHPVNGFIVRPFLAINREEIEVWLLEQQLDYITDSTNLSDEYTRNFIRLQVLPLLEKINPSVKKTIARTSAHLLAVDVIYNSVIEEAKKTVFDKEQRLSIRQLMTYPSPETILYELLKPYGFTRIVSEEIFMSLTNQAGKIFYSFSHRLVKDRDYLLITLKSLEDTAVYTISLEEEYPLPVPLSFSVEKVTETFQIEKKLTVAYFDYDKLTFPLTLRKWQKGDWFIPFGMKGRKKLSDYFSDHKYSLVQKEKSWLLCDADNVLWLIGERTDNRFRIEKTTKRVLIVNFSD